jgi:methionyl-tRNA synthetase
VGNVVDPLELIDLYGVDAFRYFVMREMALGYDADFSIDQFKLRYQSELGNTLGNLVNRAISMIKRYRAGVIPAASTSLTPEQESFRSDILASIRSHRENMDKLQIHVAVMELWKAFMRANQYVDVTAPFKMAKDESKRGDLDHVLYELAATLDLLIGELEPLLPATASKIALQLGTSLQTVRKGDLLWPGHLAGVAVGEPQVLFPRLEEPK